MLVGPGELGYSVETYYDWNLAANALVLTALMKADETPERRRALTKGLLWFATTRMPKRGSDWDADHMWPTLYGFDTLVRAMQHPIAADPELRAMIERRGREFLSVLEKCQSPKGGWAYYDDPPFTRRPTWATSFCTALILPSLRDAAELGWPVEPKVIERATRYVERCRLPNGAYEYDLRPVPRITGGEHINRTKGSLSRIQVCNWALHELGSDKVDLDSIREGLEQFIEEHKFLDIARMRPIPHEAYYANAGYFYFFGHYYAAQVIQHLPKEEREAWHRKLRPHVLKTLRKNGSASDFLASPYTILAGSSFAALTLLHGVPE